MTLDDDVAALLRRAMARTRRPMKVILNEALRRGLGEAEPRRPRKPYATRVVDLGAPLVGALDDVADVLAIAEGEAYR